MASLTKCAVATVPDAPFTSIPGAGFAGDVDGGGVSEILNHRISRVVPLESLMVES